MTAARLAPQHAATVAWMGRYYDEMERDERKAVKCYQRAVQLDAGGEGHAARRLVDVYVVCQFVCECVDVRCCLIAVFL